MAEHWVRPPVVAQEPPNPAIARWRYRLVVLVLLAALAVLVWVLVFPFLDPNSQPGIQNALGPLQQGPLHPGPLQQGPLHLVRLHQG